MGSLARLGRRELFRRRLFEPPWCTLALVGVFALVFVQVNMRSSSDLSGEGVFFGAHVGALVAAGDLYRLVTASFLHMDSVHLANNSIGLVFFGWVVEAAIGAKRTALLLLSAGISGYAIVLVPWGLDEVFQFLQVVGSSPALWGALGASVVVMTRRRADFPAGFRAHLLAWPVIIVQLYRQQDIELVSAIVHMGGCLSGILLALWFTRSDDGLPLSEGPKLTRVIVLAVGVVLVATSWAVRNERLFGSGPYVALLRERLTTPTASDDERNAYAWVMAVNSRIPTDVMKFARGVMEDVVSRDPRPEYRETLATLYYRTAEPERAVEMMQPIWWTAPDGWTGSQLARFYAATASTPSAEGGEQAQVVALPPEIRVHRFEVEDEVAFEFSPVRSVSTPATVHALVFEAGELQGLLEMRLEPGLQNNACRFRARVPWGRTLESVTVRSVWFGPVGTRGEVQRSSCSLQRMDHDVAMLP